MPLAIDSEMPSATGASTTSSNTLSYSFLNTNGTLLIVGVVCGGTTGATVVNSIAITYNGVAMTAIGTLQTGNSGASAVQLFYLLNPTTGSNTVVVTATVTGAALNTLISGATSYSGNATPTPIAQSSSTFSDVSSAEPSIILDSTNSVNIVVNVMGCGSSLDPNTDITTSDTVSWKKAVNSSSGAGNGASAHAPGNGGSLTMNWSILSDIWVIAAAELVAAVPPGQIGTGSFTDSAIGGAGG